jgi:hypothetical protein
MSGKDRTKKKNGGGEKEEGDKELHWIECDQCSRWDLYENCGFKEPYDPLKVAKINFICEFCNILDRLEISERRNREFENKLAVLESSINNSATLFSDKVKKVGDEQISNTTKLDGHMKDMWKELQEATEATKKSVKEIAESSEKPLSSTQLKQAADETAEIDRRKLNMIISGLPETYVSVAEVVQQLNMTYNLNPHLNENDIIAIDRLGRSNSPGVNRLLRLKFQTASKRRVLLTAEFKKAENGEPQLYKRPDLTPTQQALDRKLRDDLKVAGKDNFKINRGKIVPRMPQPPEAGNHGSLSSMNALKKIANQSTAKNNTPCAKDLPIPNTAIPPNVTDLVASSSVAKPGQHLATNILCANTKETQKQKTTPEGQSSAVNQGSLNQYQATQSVATNAKTTVKPTTHTINKEKDNDQDEVETSKNLTPDPINIETAVDDEVVINTKGKESSILENSKPNATKHSVL